jgi:hypothetical protein
MPSPKATSEDADEIPTLNDALTGAVCVRFSQPFVMAAYKAQLRPALSFPNF